MISPARPNLFLILKTKKYYLFGLIFLFLALISIALISTFSSTKKSPDSITQNEILPSPTPIQYNYDISQYQIDTDSDSLPDILEAPTNLNPNLNEIEACYQNKCTDPAYQQAYIPKHNIVIILDSSGSMEQLIGEETKMAAAKKAIISYISKLNNQAQVGLIQYGHLGSNSTKDKDLSCSGTQVLSPIGQLNANNVNSILDPVHSNGWTAIGLALEKSQEMFAGKEKDTNEVFVVTDGAETCNTDPIAAASKLAASSAHIKVNIIGFAINDEEKAGLEAINKAGQGSYSSANNSAELEDIFSRNLSNFTTLVNANDCIDQVRSDLISCILNLHTKIDSFRKSYINNPKLTQAQVSANESVYQSYIINLQNFEREKFQEINQIKSTFLNGL